MEEKAESTGGGGESPRRVPWVLVSPTLLDTQDEHLQAISGEFGSWLGSVSSVVEADYRQFLALASRLVQVGANTPQEADLDRVNAAHKHPVGDAVEVVLRWWYSTNPQEGTHLPPDLARWLEQVLDPALPGGQHGRVILIGHAVSLFRVDGGWARQHVLPLLRWSENAQEVAAAWQGLLSSFYLFRSFMEAIKAEFLTTAEHYGELAGYGEHYVKHLTSAALDKGDTFTWEELRTATRHMPTEGLPHALRGLTQSLQAAGDKRETYWRDRVTPYLREVWPQEKRVKTLEVAQAMTDLCMAAGKSFPLAVKALRLWLANGDRHGLVTYHLIRKSYCADYPDAALELLDRVYKGVRPENPAKLAECLEIIGKQQPSLVEDPRFKRLMKLARN
jgi:hypothetical protein